MDKSAQQGAKIGVSGGIRLFCSIFVASIIASQFNLPLNTAFLIALVIVFFPKALFGLSVWLCKGSLNVGGKIISSLWGAVKYTVSSIGKIIKRLLTKRKRR